MHVDAPKNIYFTSEDVVRGGTFKNKQTRTFICYHVNTFEVWNINWQFIVSLRKLHLHMLKKVHKIYGLHFFGFWMQLSKTTSDSGVACLCTKNVCQPHPRMFETLLFWAVVGFIYVSVAFQSQGTSDFFQFPFQVRKFPAWEVVHSLENSEFIFNVWWKGCLHFILSLDLFICLLFKKVQCSSWSVIFFRRK